MRHTIGVLLVLMFSKFFYLASISSYYEFYLIHRFGLSAHAAATIFGGVSVRGRRRHADRWAARRPHRPQAGDLVFDPRLAPFTLLLPHVDLGWTSA